MPGVLILEAMAQAAGILLSHWVDTSKNMVMIIGIDDVKIRRAVVPGDQLVLEVADCRYRTRGADVSAVARVDGQIAAEAKIRFAIRKLEQAA
jgi:3-hydroxymyristoyl/3-hydroxydecanoyl-(acyl carrier protein) dehydratase